MRYQQPPRMSRPEIERELASGDGERILTALLSAFYSEDCAWVERRCLQFLQSSSASARRGAALVLGHLAGAYGDEIDLVGASEVLTTLSADADESVRVAASDSLVDVLHSLKLQRKLH